MHPKLLFATHNQHKSDEVKNMLPNFEIFNLSDINFNKEIPETGTTFHQNSEIKVDTISKSYNGNIFADDSGLVIPALNNAPGVYSARYAGTGNSLDNINKVLKELQNSKDRSAYFIAVICLLWNGEKHFFEGKVHGQIILQNRGKKGFGYDPIFQPNGYEQTFAEISAEQKNQISHRAIAIHLMNSFLLQT